MNSISLVYDKDIKNNDSFMFFLPGRGQDVVEAVDLLRGNMSLEGSMGIIGVDPGKHGFYPPPGETVQDKQISAHLRVAIPIIDSHIQEFLKERKVSKLNCALMGFSSGAATALGLSWRFCYGACVLYSGAFFGYDYLVHPSSGSVTIDHSYPFLVIHNEDDDIFEKKLRLKPLLKYLETTHASFDSFIRPRGGHQMDKEGLKMASMFINNSLNKSPLLST